MVARSARRIVVCMLAYGLAACGRETAEPLPDPVEARANEEAVQADLFPMLLEGACPGEGCMYGEWVACEETALYESPGAGALPAGVLASGVRFEVTTGVVVVERPTVVVVTAPTQQDRYSPSSLTFQTGDTLKVLDYQGEGFFNVLYGDTIVSTFVFWDWINSGPQDNQSGTVLQEGDAAFWVATSHAGQDRWLNVNSSRVANPNALSPDPAVCR